MRRLRKNSRGSPIRDAPREPMAEGAIPLRRNRYRKWSPMSDAGLVQFAQNFMKEKGITGRKQLEEADSGLYTVLLVRKLMSKVGFERKRRECRDWSSMSDDQLIRHTRGFINERGITGRKELHKADVGLYDALQRRGLLAKVGFEQKRRAWSSMTGFQLIQHARGFMKEKGMTGKKQLQEADHGLYEALRKRKLLAKAGFESKLRESRDWSSMTDGQLMRHLHEFAIANEISGREQLRKADKGLYDALYRRNLLAKAGFESKLRESRDWSSMTDYQLIQHAQDFMKENGISGRKQLDKADPGLYAALRMRNLLSKVGFEQKQREYRDWSSMTDRQFVQCAQDHIKKNGITGRRRLYKADPGLYSALRKRKLLSAVFSDIEQSKKQSLESELVSGLRKAADAMAEFGGERE